MLRYIILSTLAFIATLSYGQATLYSTDFESALPEWTFAGDISPNSWIKGICAANGSSGAGSKSLHITSGGVVPGCGPTGIDQYSYVNSPLGSYSAIAYTPVDGRCASSLRAVFDYRIGTLTAQDYGTLIYSTDFGASWTPIATLTTSAAWTSADIPLPGVLDFSEFFIGVSFTYDDGTAAFEPLAIDNFKVRGTDNQPPALTCVTAANQEVNASCNAIAENYSKYILTMSDNCTDSAQIIVTQNILIGSSIPSLPGTSTTVILTVKDESNNQNTCSFTLNITDETNPTILTCAPNATINVDNLCKATMGDYRSLVSATDNCPGTLTYTQNPPAGTIINGSGVVSNVVITVTDPFGNAVDCDFEVTSVDNILPTITCPTTRTIYADAVMCQASLLDYTGLAVFSDNCVSNSSMTVTQVPAPSTFVNSDQTITLTLTGGIPATPQQCQFTVDFIDTIKPTIICPVAPIKYLNAACEVEIPDFIPGVTWADNCTSSISNMTFTQFPAAGTLTSTNQFITLTAIDQAGNWRTCSMEQIVVDTIRPVLNCPVNQTVNFDNACSAAIPDYTGLVTDNENCLFLSGVIYSQSPVPTTNFNSITTITITGEDESGNIGTCSFTATPVDVTVPTIICPGPTTVNTNSGCTYVLPNVTGFATGLDNCTASGALIYSQTPLAGAVLPIGSQTISISVKDQFNNTATCSYQLTVADQTAPIINCPAAQNISVGSNCTGVLGNYTGLVTMTDNCNSSSQLTLTQAPASGTVINANTQITMTSTDLNGNVGTCSFFAVIIDDTDPVVTCPATYDVAINSSCQYSIPDLSGQVSGTDNCSSFANMTITQNPVAGSMDGSLTPVLITLTDQQGNSATCITTLTPIDTEAPTITCPSPAPVNNGTNCNYTLGFYGSTAMILDNCSDYAVTQTPAAGSIIQAGTTTIQLEVMDAGGNTAQCSFNLQVIETQAPTITCPSNISTCDPVVTYSTPVYNDNCGATISQTDVTGYTSGDTFPIGTTTLTYTVVDASSNSQSCSFQIEVLEYPSQANIVEDTISLCQITSTVINADPAINGIGVWTVLAPGQAFFNNQFANSTGVNNIGYGINELVWTISTAQCGETSDTIIVLVSQTPLPASAQDTLLACNQNSVNLSASVPLYGIGTWTSLQGATIADVNLATSAVSNLAPGWNQLVWTVSNGSCPTSDDTTNIFATPTAQIAMSDTAICIENGAILLNGTSPLPDQSVSWMFLSGIGHLSNVQSATTVLEEIGVGANVLTYSMAHDQCPTTVDTITIVASLCDGFNPIIPTVITPNFDGLNDLFVINYLDLIYPECKVLIFNRWGSIVYESVGYQDPWDGTYNGEDLPMGTYFYKVELNDSESTVYNGSISIIR